MTSADPNAATSSGHVVVQNCSNTALDAAALRRSEATLWHGLQVRLGLRPGSRTGKQAANKSKRPSRRMRLEPSNLRLRPVCFALPFVKSALQGVDLATHLLRCVSKLSVGFHGDGADEKLIGRSLGVVIEDVAD